MFFAVRLFIHISNQISTLRKNWLIFQNSSMDILGFLRCSDISIVIKPLRLCMRIYIVSFFIIYHELILFFIETISFTRIILKVTIRRTLKLILLHENIIILNSRIILIRLYRFFVRFLLILARPWNLIILLVLIILNLSKMCQRIIIIFDFFRPFHRTLR